ncbi:MAG: UDP-N-acetylmuramoyl-L-alanyl-D-glutamate--2,6-diaminopimelate ligase [Coriobacteriales bacterium]|nr:UDP-N-acetylmuramoyl-L-alanyl-D-glutamate--2,6-diaminopimelate ligase [Coriobacteriales bacterium]
MATRLLYDLLVDIDHTGVGDDEAQDLRIVDLAYRSDRVVPGSLFFAIPGAKADGHDFALDAAIRGAVALLVERPVDTALPQVLCADSRMALALVSRTFFGDPSARLVVSAITGTNGKTTSSYLIDWICRSVLARALNTVDDDLASAGTSAPAGISASTAAPAPVPAPAFADTSASADSLNTTVSRAADAFEKTGLIGTVETRIGAVRQSSRHTTPESYELQKLFAHCLAQGLTHVAMEVSSHAIELKRVAGVHFAVAAFTNLTQDHLDFHGSMEAYFEAKAALFDSLLVARRVITIDDEWGRRLLARCQKAGFEALTCGLSPDADIRARDIAYSSRSTALTLETPEGDFALSYPLIGGFNVSNVLLAAATAYALGFAWPDITAALATTPQIPGRLERVDDPAGRVEVFVDYSHTPDSIAKALAALDSLKGARRTLIVFGCGGDRDATKRPLMGAAALAADYCIVTSDNPRSEDPQAIIEDILPGMAGGQDRYEVEPDRRRAIARALLIAEPGDLVLIAGKGHEDYQLVGDQVLDFDDRLVAAEELALFADTHMQAAEQREILARNGEALLAGTYMQTVGTECALASNDPAGRQERP